MLTDSFVNDALLDVGVGLEQGGAGVTQGLVGSDRHRDQDAGGLSAAVGRGSGRTRDYTLWDQQARHVIAAGHPYTRRSAVQQRTRTASD